MTESRSGSARGASAAGRTPDGGLGGSAFWIVAAGAVLVLGLVLRTDAPLDGPSPTAQPEAPAPAAVPDRMPEAATRSEPDATVAEPARPAAVPPPAGPGTRLVERALRDARRASPSAGVWTAQVAVLCDASGAEVLVSKFENDARLFVVPAEIGDRSCFRICWGSFPDAGAARAASVPPALLGGGKATPKQFTEVLP